MFACALFVVPNALSAIYNVNRSDDIDHGVCEAVTGCTLRDAINAANSSAGADDITFQIGIGGSYTISPATPLPNITASVTVDATTQTGYAGAPLIELDGSVAGPGIDGLRATGGATTIFGLAIVNFGGAGIAFSGSSSGSFVAGNYIGMGAGGSVAQGNSLGVLVAATNTTIGGTNEAARNVISGNTGNGVTVSGTGNQILGNYIGLDASGNLARPNLRGVVVAANSNTIGNIDTGNVVSGNTLVGVAISSASSNTVTGNHVGTDADGTTAVPNGGGGVQVVGSATPASANTISFNVISGNSGFGVEVNGSTSAPSATANTLTGNVIGLDAAEKHALGNTGPGVSIASGSGIGNNTIGGDTDDEENVIAYNSKGIVTGAVTSRNRFLRNSIHDNTGLGIDLNNDGVTANDPNDVDADLVNFPVLDPFPSRDSSGKVTMSGTYDGSLPGAHYRFDFYASAACDGSGNGEGANWIGKYEATADASGDVAINTVDGLTGYVGPQSKITATTTDEVGNTSEFSACVQPNVPAAINWTVDTNAVDDDGACQNAPDGDCTLPEAINAVNAGSGEQTISFDLPPGSLTISPTDLNPLPPIVRDVYIDGTSQPGYTGTPVVQLDGSAMVFPPGSADGLDVTSGIGGDTGTDGTTIRGLSITGFVGSGISLDDPDGSVVEGNYIGVAPDGVTAVGNGNGGFGDAGVSIRSSNNRIDGNVISGNDGTGIDFLDGTGNLVTGNRIGTNAAGDGALPNTGNGIVFEDASFQTIGGTGPGEGNLISGNGENGIWLNSGYEFAQARFQGNTIGLAADGATALPNAGAGMLIESVDEAHVGGTAPGAGNVISGNGGTGIDVQFSSDSRIQGNIIGLNAAGTAGVPNGTSEVIVDGSSDRIQIGGTTAGARNVISGGTSGYGILLDGTSGAVVQGNYVGTDVTGEIGLGNGDGIDVTSGGQDNTIGGVVAGARNVISGNDSVGVRLDLAGPNNRILGNSIGTDKDETDVIPNKVGIELDGTADTIIGSTSPGAGNVVGGSIDAGILFFLGGTGSNTVAGNFVGTDRSKTIDLANGDGMRFASGTGSGSLVGPDNVFANNTGEGIQVSGGTGNRISADSIYDNGGKGILLDGGNNGQTSPTVTSAVKVAATTYIQGTLTSAVNTSYFIEYFLTPTCAGEPQGKTYLGFQSVTTDGSGNAPISIASSAPAIGQAITATATSQATNDTSEFSACATVTNTLSIAPEADTFVSNGAPTVNYGTKDYADTYGGFSPVCVPLSAPAYALMRFDLSSIPAGAMVTNVELDTTTRAGYAQDGDPAHWAIFIPNDSWSETGVTWDTRPADGITKVGDPAFSGGPDIRQSSLSFGAADVFRAGCSADPDPAGNQTKVFPSTDDGFPRTVAEAEAGFIDRVAKERSGDDKLSIELWTPNCPVCPAGTDKAYWARYYTREAADPTVRPRLVITLAPSAVATNLSLVPSPTSTTAGAARVKLSDVPPSVLLAPQSSSQTAPVNETPINETPVNELPVNELPINETPVNELGFDTLAASIPALGDITLASIPLLRTGGWPAALTGTPLATLPLQNVTLRDYYALPTSVNPETRTSPPPIAPITLADLDLSHSPLGSLPADAIVLANVQLSWLRDLDVWCRLFGTVYCPSGATGLTNTTVMAAALQGAPVNETPVNETPVNETPVNEIPVNEVPVNETPVNEVPVNELPVNETPVNELPINETPVNELPVNEILLTTPVNETPVNELPVNEIMSHNATVTNSPVNEIPVNELATPNTIVVCAPTLPAPSGTVDCATATLGQAYAAGALRPGITLGDLIVADGAAPDALDGVTLGDLRFYDDITLRGLIDSYPDGTFTLGDYFLLVLRSPTASQGLGWERLNISDGDIQQYSTGGSTVGYRAQFTVQANGGPSGVPSSVAVNATLADGFFYVPASSKLVSSATSCSTAAPAIADPTKTTLSDGHVKLTWTVNTTVGNGYAICFTMRPGIELGPQAASLDATPTGGVAATANGTTLDVGDTLESNNDATTAPQVFTDSFYLSYLTSASDVDYYRFAAPPIGTVVTIHLSHLPTDFDLVAYGPPETQLRPSLSSTPPLDTPPVTDSGFELTHATDALPSQTLDDLRLQTNLPMVGVSASRNTDPEDIVFISQGGTGFYTIQVTGYNGATSSDPYMLRVQTQPPRQTSNVPARTITGTAGPALPALPTGLNTVFVVNRKQLEGVYGATAASNVMSALANDSSLFTSLGYPNVTLSLDNPTNDSNGAVAAAYSNWNAHPGDPAAANGVVAAINAMIDSKIRSQLNGAGLKYLVLVGGDQVIPLARLDDFTIAAGNETGYAANFPTTSDLFSSLNAGQMLSDDPYGDTNPIPYLTRQLYIPELAVGRLVETPADIVRTLNNFVSTAVAGKLDPTSSLTTGYDFLNDAAQEVNNAFSRFGNNAKTLFDDPTLTTDGWTLQNLLDSFLPLTTPAPSITSLNGHASHYQFAPAIRPSGTPLFTTTSVSTSNTSLGNRLIFGMGCHAGLSVADSIVTASNLDWPEEFAQKSAGAYLGNTGFGFGDSLVVAYSEELNKLFAQRIGAGSSVGEALAAAKQAYYGELGVFGVYDEKAMAEFTLYGLPMWKVTGPPATSGAGAQALAASTVTASPTQGADATAAAAPLGVVTDPVTGLDAETFSVDPTNTQHTTAQGDYWSGPDGVQVTHLRPIEPKAFVTLGGTTGHGALITELTSGDQDCINPVYARPVLDLTGTEPEIPFSDVAFPSKLQSLRTFVTPTGVQQRLVLVTGQFFTYACASNSDPQLGVQRLFSHIAGRVYRSTSTDFSPPAYQRVESTAVGTNAAFIVDVTDTTPSTDAGKQVIVAVRSGPQTAWTFINLTQSTTSATRWTGGTPVADANDYEYFVEAVDKNGNVAVTTNKGFYFTGAPAPPPPTGGIEAHLTGTTSNGWYTPSAGLSITAPQGVTIQVSVDGGPYGPAPQTITGDGVHVIDIRASNGGTAELIAPVDTTPPEIVINTPANGGSYVLNSIVPADYFCRDSGSGVETPCRGSVANGANIDTSTVGQHTFTVDGGIPGAPVRDAAGHATPAKTVMYTVVYRPILFSSTRSSGGDIYSVNPNGSGLTQLTSTAGLDEQPSWSPDGSRIVFASARNNAMGSGLDIYVMDANGQNVQRLTTASNDDTAPAWSQDGRKIVFQSKRDGNPEIYVMNADGTGQTRLTNNKMQDAEPAFSPNGQKIVFLSDRNGILNVWIMDAGGTNQKPLTSTKQPDANPAWSPDGSKIVWASKRGDNKGTVFDIYTMTPTGSGVTRLTTSKSGDFEPSYSRDGLRIAFTSLRDGNQEIYTMSANGSGAQRVTTNAAADHQPDW